MPPHTRRTPKKVYRVSGGKVQGSSLAELKVCAFVSPRKTGTTIEPRKKSGSAKPHVSGASVQRRESATNHSISMETQIANRMAAALAASRRRNG